MTTIDQIMKNPLRPLLLATALLSAAGCASYVPTAVEATTLTVTKTEERSARLGLKIVFPAGDYVPDFSNKHGTFYLAPSSVIFSSVGIHTPMRGGIFIPAIGAKDQRQAAWKQLSSGDALGGILSSGTPSIYTYPLDQPVTFSRKVANLVEPASPIRVGAQ